MFPRDSKKGIGIPKRSPELAEEGEKEECQRTPNLAGGQHRMFCVESIGLPTASINPYLESLGNNVPVVI